MNSTEQDLVAQWGPPDQVYESGGQKYLTYHRSSQAYLPGVEPTYQTTYYGTYATTTPIGGSPPQTINLNCKTTFTITNGKITSWRYEGNNCAA
ncbi:hypothetical protein FRZ61_01320 [Hypericibacter adhaerens]|uniref:Uncharacterized protein n=1 Tax=Hypericibacter adhaerens TaxID=2602016 RepID=A0A5J6MZV9_9PROT|nr:hypothetical protein FRZ61_01320 [Hypericibacter adhaerens]